MIVAKINILFKTDYSSCIRVFETIQGDVPFIGFLKLRKEKGIGFPFKKETFREYLRC